MTESLKLSEIHRTNIEYERQRHLANWLIKSSPHMAKPSTPPKSQQQQQQQQQKLNTKNGTITQNAILYLQQKPNLNNLAVSRTPLFNSQTNLPLQIVTSQEGHKPKLRRFNSHDTSANMFSVADFENARLARRNEMELKQRQQQNRYKMNSLSSGGDCSTGDSKGSKFSSEVSVERTKQTKTPNLSTLFHLRIFFLSLSPNSHTPNYYQLICFSKDVHFRVLCAFHHSSATKPSSRPVRMDRDRRLASRKTQRSSRTANCVCCSGI